MPVNIYAPTTSADTLTPVELDLYHQIMAYRAEEGRPPIPLSNGLTATAGRHSIDQYHNIEVPGVGRPAGANLHSWSDAPYMSDGSTLDAMQGAPSRLGTTYPGRGYEISAAGQDTIELALNSWQLSPPHDTVIRNAEMWAGFDWGAIGIGVEQFPRVAEGPIRFGEYYNVWFGVYGDPAGGPLIEGTNASEALTLTVFADRVAARGGNDTIRARDGDDVIVLGGGSNTIHGGTGNDVLQIGATSSHVAVADTAAGFNVTVNGLTSRTTSVEYLHLDDGIFSVGAEGLRPDSLPDPSPPPGPTGPPPRPAQGVDPSPAVMDRLPAGTQGGTQGSNDLGSNGPGRRIEGTGAADELGAPPTDDTILGNGGDDWISANDGNDQIAAGDGNDTIGAGNGHDNIGGGEGDDHVVAGAGHDTIGGGMGHDLINGGLGNDVIAGGAGNDEIYGEDGNDAVGGSYGDDTISGGGGADDLGGGTGRDVIAGFAGNDSIGGGEGHDLVFGNDGNDFLAGGGRNDTVIGGAGDDTINGGEGDDLLFGESSEWGEEGADLFVFNAFTAGERDFIGDFENGIDRIMLVGVENAPGSGLGGKLAALGIGSANVDGVRVATFTYEGHRIDVAGIRADQLGLDDFVFV